MRHQEGGEWGIRREAGRGIGHQDDGPESVRVMLIGTRDFNQPLVLTLGVIWHTRRREAGLKEVGEMGDPVKGDGVGHQ